MINSGMMTSKTDMWETPQYFFNNLNKEFNFDIDVCAISSNAKCDKYFTPQQNGLLQRWNCKCYMNPPYGRQISVWVEKAYESAINGATVVCLLPSRTDTRWFHEYCLKSSDIRFIKGRLKFSNSKNAAPFPSIVVVFSPETLRGAHK